MPFILIGVAAAAALGIWLYERSKPGTATAANVGPTLTPNVTVPISLAGGSVSVSPPAGSSFNYLYPPNGNAMTLSGMTSFTIDGSLGTGDYAFQWANPDGSSGAADVTAS